jgi:hypothetical protein
MAMHQKPDDAQKDQPLPLTVGFVFALGLLIAGGWLLMFRLLATRW